MNIVHNRSYEAWAPVVARVLVAAQFAVGAYFKLTMFGGEVSATASVGVPFPQVAVVLALIFEIALILALLSGIQIRLLSFLGALYVALLAVLFYHNWNDQMSFGLFVSHFGLAAALIYVSVFGARKLG